MAMIIEQVVGNEADVFQDIIEIEPTDIHQRVPLFVGSEDMVDESMRFMREYSDENLQPSYVSK